MFTILSPHARTCTQIPTPALTHSPPRLHSYTHSQSHSHARSHSQKFTHNYTVTLTPSPSLTHSLTLIQADFEYGEAYDVIDFFAVIIFVADAVGQIEGRVVGAGGRGCRGLRLGARCR